MKHWSALLAVLLAAVNAGAEPYGHLPEVARTPERFLISRTARQTPATFCLAFPKNNPDLLSPQEAGLHTSAALYEWTQGTAQRIRAAGREKEFADVLPLLENARFEQLPACNLSGYPQTEAFFDLHPKARRADLTVIFSDDYCARVRRAPVSFYTADDAALPPLICIVRGDHLSLLSKDARIQNSMLHTSQDRELFNQAETTLQAAAQGKGNHAQLWKLDRLFSYDASGLYSVVAHETGHAFGLADEYTARNYDPLYSSLHAHAGLMKRLYDPAGCTETDGIITLLDRATDTQRTFASFCQNGVTFKNGVEQVDEISPATVRISQGRTALYSLLPSSPDTQTLLAEILETDLSPQTQEILQKAFSARDFSGMEIYSGGQQKQDSVRTGVWEMIIRRDNHFTALGAVYDKQGRLTAVTPKRVSADYARQRLERIRRHAELKTARIEEKLKSAF